MGFYTVVVLPAVAPNPCLEFSRHFDSTTLHVVVAVVFSSFSKKEITHHVEVSHDHCEYIEVENELQPTACLLTPKMSRALFTCLGNKALAARTAFFTFLLPKAFLARLVISCLITCSAFRLTPRVKPAFNPLKVLLGSFKGFRVLLSP